MSGAPFPNPLEEAMSKNVDFDPAMHDSLKSGDILKPVGRSDPGTDTGKPAERDDSDTDTGKPTGTPSPTSR